MSIQFSRGRLYAGKQRKHWENPVWYEPIHEEEEPKDLTIQNLAPDAALFHSRKGTESDPMEGEVAWEPLFDPNYFESNSKKERLRMQKMLLYDAW